jgi:hypothetical protein
MCQQELKNTTISNPRNFAPPNWKPLKQWLPPGEREQFDWMWRQGECEYYRYTRTGRYLVLDPFGQRLKNEMLVFSALLLYELGTSFRRAAQWLG